MANSIPWFDRKVQPHCKVSVDPVKLLFCFFYNKCFMLGSLWSHLNRCLSLKQLRLEANLISTVRKRHTTTTILCLIRLRPMNTERRNRLDVPWSECLELMQGEASFLRPCLLGSCVRLLLWTGPHHHVVHSVGRILFIKKDWRHNVLLTHLTICVLCGIHQL